MIQVTNNHALKIEAMNYVLYKFREIDPTKSPRFKEGDSTEIKQEWRAETRYYPLSTTGLAAALQEIAHREVIEKTNGEIKLSEYVKQLRDMHEQLRLAVEGVMEC
jgi:isocitrate dehydrogenase kinase/phosphatase